MTRTEETSAQDLGTSLDGRTMRRTRNRTAVINALLELIKEGDYEPGAAEIAQRAGVSHRSVFRYFDDLGDLVRTAVSQQFEEAETLAHIENLGLGDFDDRVERYVTARLGLWSFVNDVALLTRIKSLSIPNIDATFMTILQTFRADVETHFAAEMDSLTEERRQSAGDAVLVLSSHDSYDLHHRLLKHDDLQIHDSWRRSISMLLGG